MATFSLLGQALQTVRSYWPLSIIGFFLLRSLHRRYLHPLHAVPGPFLASITGLWYLVVYLTNKEHQRSTIRLHERYGQVVRIRPNTVIISNPSDFSTYFTWPRSEYFVAIRGHPKVWSHAADLDLEQHNLKKRNLMGGFAMSQVLKNESALDIRVSEFMGKLTEKCDQIFDIAPWTQFATFDIAMEMIFSNPVGFLAAGRDVNGIIASLHNLATFVGVAGLQPWIAKLLMHPKLFPLIGPKPTDKFGPGAFNGFVYKQVARRLENRSSDVCRPDACQWILEHRDKDGQHMSQVQLEAECTSLALAASDTTAGTLRALILAIGSNPRILQKFREQIDSADAKGLLSTPPTHQEMQQHIPYLESLFKEAQRTFPIVAVPAFRSVTKPGTYLSGHFLPAGTEVGLSQWAVGHNPHIHGDDYLLFRPERWTDDLSHDPAAQKRRDQSEVWFSGGNMLCTGRNIATLEVYKIITQFFRMFDVEIVDAQRPWKVKADLVMLHSDFFVKLTKRKRGDVLVGGEGKKE